MDLIDTKEKKNLLNEVICEHFLRRGSIDIVDSLVEEGHMFSNEEKRQPFIEMNYILERLRFKDVQPALEYVLLIT